MSTPELPVARTCPFTQPELHARSSDEEPVTRVRLPNGSRAWFVTRYEDVRTVLSDPRFSSDREKPGFPRLSRGNDKEPVRTMLGMDAEEHRAARGGVLGEFTLRRVNALRPRIQEIVDGLIDDLLAASHPADLVPSLALPVPSLLICEQLGVPYVDHAFFQENTEKLFSRETPPEETAATYARLHRYFDELITAKEAAPSDDLLGRQITESRAAGTYDHAYLVGLAFLLLAAGHESTANMISVGVLGLLENPRQLRLIAADQGKTPVAVEELLRFFSITDTVPLRVALADVELGGVLIKAGEGVLPSLYAANWDRSVFDSPDVLDVERGARHHVAFGYGPHQCLGQNLARAELEIVFETLFRRIPGLKLAVDVDEIPTKEKASVYGLYRLPVTW
ncbi:cytochrome P450 [Pseudonocardia sp. CA-142604]|uniref:cytochrome P450 n=1 Tax=Pseudonocardia sp. CA-142604 TaxID=3240024 RepID=UPI003D906BB5